GAADFSDVPVGRYDVKVSDDAHGRVCAADVAVTARSEIEPIVIHMGQRSALVVKIMDERHLPRPGVALYAFDGAGIEAGEEMRHETDEKGTATFWGLAPGIYRVFAQEPEAAPFVAG